MITRRHFSLGFYAACAARLCAQSEAVFTALAQDVRVDTAITSGQRPVRGLRAEHFVLLDNDRPQPIRSVTAEELPLDLILLVHTVPQMESNRVTSSAKARLLNGAANVLLKTRPEDRVAILTHAVDPRIEMPFGNDRDAMAAALRHIASMEYQVGFSELLTIEYAVRMFAELGTQPNRRRLIVRLGAWQSKGLDYADEPIVRRLWSEHIVFSNIEILMPGGGFNPGFNIVGQLYNGAEDVEPIGPRYRASNPNHIANATGGDALRFLDPQNPLDLITPMRQRYVLWFTQPQGLEPGQERKITVDLAPEIRRRYPDAVVRAREGYITR